MSDPVTGVPAPEERMDDIRAVMDAAGSERAALFGVFEGGPLSLLYAARHPGRVSALVLYAGLAKFTQNGDYPWGWSPAAIQLYLAASEEGWGSGAGADLLAPGLAADDNYRRWFARLVRMSASPGQATTLLKMNTEIDVRDVLPQVQAPALVLHREGDLLVDAGHSRYLAEHIPGAKHVELPGDDHWPWAGDAERIARETQEHVTGARGMPEPERVLTTLLFTDIVGSTERASELGDRRWREVLEDHYMLVRRELDRFRGREVKTIGDGFFASFDSPTRAIRCAAAIRRGGAAARRRAAGRRPHRRVRDDRRRPRRDRRPRRAPGSRPRPSPARSSSRALCRELIDGSGVRFEDRGAFSLKGVDGERRLFAAEVER